MRGVIREHFAVEVNSEAEKIAVLSTAWFTCHAQYDNGFGEDYGENMERCIGYCSRNRILFAKKRNFMEVLCGCGDDVTLIEARDFLKDEIGFLKSCELPIGVIVESEEEVEPMIKAMWKLFPSKAPKDILVMDANIRHARNMFGKCHNTCVVEFDEDTMFPWVSDLGSFWGELGYCDIEMPVVLASTLIEYAIEYAKVSKTEPAAPSRYKNGDVVLVRTASHNVVMAFIVNQIKEGWYLAKDIFTSKCMLVTENKVEGANVIQGASP